MRLKKQKGFALITLIIAMVLMAALGAGIYTLTTSSTFSELLATRDYNAYQLAKAGLRYAAFNGDSSVGTYCMSDGRCFTISVDASDPTVRKYISKGYINKDTFLEANRLLAYNMPYSPGKTTISFEDDMGDIPQPNVGWGMNKTGAVEVDYTNKEINLGDGTPSTTDAFGSVVYGGGSYLGNCSYGICDFGAGIHAYFEFKFFPEDSSTNSDLSADGFTFAIFNGTNNLVTATGGVPPDVASLGELVGYAGPGTHVGTEGPGWQPPKLAIEFDSYPNTNANSITVPLSRRDPTPFRDHMALILWGENNAAPYRTDATIANAVGLRCAPNDEFVRSLYRSIFGRNAELGGLQYWTNILNGQTTTALQNTARDNFIRGFFFGDGAPEYNAGSGKTDTQYLTDVLQAALGQNPQYTYCAPENGNCTFTGRKTVRYGANGSYFFKFDQTSPVACTNDNFGDPIYGTVKQCDYTNTPTFTEGYWTECAPENGNCAFTGQKIVRYGASGSYYYKYDQTSPVACDNTNFGDPIVGTFKHCDTLDRTAFLNAVLYSTQYTNNVTSCGNYSYDSAQQMGTYNCGGVSQKGTSLDCSGLPLSLYNRDTLDDNVHSEGGTESSFTALPLSPQNSGVGTGYYVVPNGPCASIGGTCWGFEDGNTHKFRIEVLRDTTPHTCSRDYSGASPPLPPGNCYNYRVKSWIDCDGGNPTGCTGTQITNMKNVSVAFTGANPQIDRIIELTESRHAQFNKMIFGWTGATGQPVSGLGQKVTLSNFELFFRTPQACPAVTSITPVSASLPGGTVGAAYSQQTLDAAPTSAAPFTWFVAGGSLPAGLSLSPAGVISGTPTAAGTSNFTVRATNICGASLSKAYSIVVLSPAPTVTGISPSTHSNDNTQFNVSITGTGFQSGATVTRSAGTGGTFTIGTVNVVSATQITAQFQINGNVPVGAQTIRVTNSDGQYGQIGFTVTYRCSGGTITTSGVSTIHTFNSSGTLSCNAAASAEVLVVAGGGGAGRGTTNTNRNAGGGGAGGLIYKANHSVTVGSTTVTVGAGGAGSSNTNNQGGNGGNSVFGTLTAIGGGGGASSSDRNGNNGGSGGGAARFGNNYGTGGSATQPSQGGDSGTYGFGNNGANSTNGGAGGGGGAGAAGTVTTGGLGKAYWGTSYATGGNAQSNNADGATNTGNGGNAAAANSNNSGGDGGSGIVIIRY